MMMKAMRAEKVYWEKKRALSSKPGLTTTARQMRNARKREYEPMPIKRGEFPLVNNDSDYNGRHRSKPWS